MRKNFKIGAVILLLLFVLLTGISLSLRYAPIQNFLVQKTTAYLSDKFGVPVKVDYFSWNLFKDIELNGFYMADKDGDTLIAAKSLYIDIPFWSLLQKKIEVSSILLDQAHVYLKADTAGVLNITKIFASKEKKQKSSNTSLDWAVDLDKIKITSSDFLFDDAKNKSKISVKLPEAIIAIDDLGLKNHNTIIKSFTVNNPIIAINNNRKDKTEEEEHLPIHFLDSITSLKINEIAINNAKFDFNNLWKDAKKEGIDFNHLSLSKIDILLKDARVKADSIFTTIKQINLQEKSGFAINKLNADAKISVNEITLKNLSLITPNSKVSNAFSLTFNHFADFKYFNDKVKMKANLKDTKFALKDLQYFVPTIQKFAHNDFKINGKIEGKIASLRGKDLQVQYSNNTLLNGDFSADGLPDFQNTFISFKLANFQTNSADVQKFYPYKALPKELAKLGTIRFKGQFDGFPSDFVANGNLHTALGSANSDINFKYNKETGKSNYSGNLALQHFNIGKLLDKENEITYASFDAKVNGSGLNLKDLNAKVDGNVSELVFRGHDYVATKINGTFKNKSFAGDLKINDEFLAADFSGLVDMAGAIPKFAFDAMIKKADLKSMNLTKDDVQISGKLSTNFVGKKIDDLVGEINASQLYIKRNNNELSINNIKINSAQFENEIKKITIVSPYLEGEIYGKYNFTDLPRAIKNYLYTTFTKNPENNLKVVKAQQFDFEIRIYDSSGITKMIDPRFTMIRNSRIEGNFNSIANKVNLTANIPELIFDKYKIRNNAVSFESENGQLHLLSTTDKLFIKDSLMLDTLVIKTNSVGEKFRFETMLFDKKHYNRGYLEAFITPQKGSTDISFSPSEIFLGGNKWTFAENNKINIAKKIIKAENLSFSSGNQQLTLKTFLTNDTATGINLIAKETELSDFLGLFNAKAKDIKGRVNGNVIVGQVFYSPAILANVDVNQLMWGNSSLGDLKIRSNLTDSLNKINIYATLKNEINNIDIYGTYSLAKNGPGFDLTANIQKGDLAFLNNPFFVKYLKNATGDFTANLTVKGPLNKIDLNGKLLINKAKLTVSFLNTTYTLNNQTIFVKENYFDVGNLVFNDVYNNQLTGTGKIYHSYFKNFTLDLKVVTPNAQCLNTTEAMMPSFFGEVMASGTILFSGVIPLVDIKAFAKTNINTHCAIPIKSSYETNAYSFYKFVNKKDTVVTTVKKKETAIKLKGVNFMLDLDVTPDAVLDINLDPAAGDKLTSRGSGNIKIEILRNGKFNIFGLYEVDRGDYLFTLQNIINKKFTLKKGGTINFSGDIYRAQLNMDASYNVRTSTYDLVADDNDPTFSILSDEAISRSKNRVMTNLLLKIKGVLISPEIAFDIAPQDVDPTIKAYVDTKIQLLRNNEAEMNKQVFGLLVMNKFLPINSSAMQSFTNQNGSSSSAAINTVSEFLSSQLSRYMSDFFENLNVKDLDFKLNFRQYNQTASSTDPIPSTTFDQRRELQLALSKRFLNNRLSINVGGNLDFGDKTSDNGGVSTTKQTTNITGDFQIEYTLDKNGNWRVKAFNRGDYDNFSQKNINKTGIGLSYRKEFDSLSDFFKKKKKKKEPTPQISSYSKKEEVIEEVVESTKTPIGDF